MLALNGGADALDAVAGLSAPIPVIGQALVVGNVFVGFGVLAVTQFWLIMKRGITFKKQATYLTGALVDLIPILNILPTKTATLIIAMYLINQEQAAGGQETTAESGETSKAGEAVGQAGVAEPAPAVQTE